MNHLSLNELDRALLWFQRAIDVHPGLETIQKYVHALRHHQNEKQSKDPKPRESNEEKL